MVKAIGVPLGLTQQFSEWRSKKNDDKTVAFPGLGDTMAKMFFCKKMRLSGKAPAMILLVGHGWVPPIPLPNVSRLSNALYFPKDKVHVFVDD